MKEANLVFVTENERKLKSVRITNNKGDIRNLYNLKCSACLPCSGQLKNTEF